MGWNVVAEAAASPVPLGRGIDGVDLLVLGRRLSAAAGGPRRAGRDLHPHPLSRSAAISTIPPARRSASSPRSAGRLYRTGDLGRYAAGRRGRPTPAAPTARSRSAASASSPAEIEAALGRLHRRSGEAVVVARDERGERYLVAYVVAARRRAAGPRRPSCGRSSPAGCPTHMVPAAFVVLPALPLTPNGKIDRRALPAPRAGSARRSSRAPRDAGGGACSPASGPSCCALDRVGVARQLLRAGRPLAAGHPGRLAGARGLRRGDPAAGGSSRRPRSPAWRRGSSGSCGSPAASPPRRRSSRVPRDRPLPLSFAQQRLWFLDQLEPASPVYNMPAAVRLAGRLDVAALAAALSEIVRRHEALRTTFRATADGRPVQVIAPRGAACRCRWSTSRRCRPRRRAGEARRLAAEEARAAVRPRRAGRCCAPACCGWRRRTTSLLLTMHHIVSDGWSMRRAGPRAGARSTRRSSRAGRRRSPSCRCSTPTSPSGSGEWLQRRGAGGAARLLAAAARRRCRRAGAARRPAAAGGPRSGRGAQPPLDAAAPSCAGALQAAGRAGGRDALHGAARRLRRPCSTATAARTTAWSARRSPAARGARSRG